MFWLRSCICIKVGVVKIMYMYQSGVLLFALQCASRAMPLQPAPSAPEAPTPSEVLLQQQPNVSDVPKEPQQQAEGPHQLLLAPVSHIKQLRASCL